MILNNQWHMRMCFSNLTLSTTFNDIKRTHKMMKCSFSDLGGLFIRPNTKLIHSELISPIRWCFATITRAQPAIMNTLTESSLQWYDMRKHLLRTLLLITKISCRFQGSLVSLFYCFLPVKIAKGRSECTEKDKENCHINSNSNNKRQQSSKWS